MTVKSEYAFDVDTTATQVSDDHWQLMMVGDWNIGTNPNGGYILACLLRAMATRVPDTPDPIAVTTHYLRPGLPDKTADLRVSVVRQGRRTATVTGTMEQDGKARITCTATFGNLEPGQITTAERSITPIAPTLPPPSECTTRTELAQAVELPIMDRLDVLIDPQYVVSGQHKDATISGWIRFRDQRPIDCLALLLFCDAFPPSVFTLYGPIGWVPTIELSVHIRQRPTTDWIKGTFNTADLNGNLFIEDGSLWDENDQLLARCRQLQLILK
jgi:acyl-CoA thioesterase